MTDKKVERISLTELYKTPSIRNYVYDVLSEEFDAVFERLMKEAKNVRSLLVKQAKLNRENIKEMFIEYGHELETLEHLKKILDALRVCDEVDESDSLMNLSQCS